MIRRLDPKDPGEIRTLTFDFGPDLKAETISGTPTASIAMYTGTDAQSANVLYGSPVVVGQRVTVRVRNGVLDAEYLIKVLVTTNLGNIYAIGAVLPVKNVGTF